MTKQERQELRIRVAQLCGWRRIQRPPSDPESLWPDEAIWEIIKDTMIPPDGKLLRDCGEAGMKMARIPDYPSDLNAMQKAVLSRGGQFIVSFNTALLEHAKRQNKFMCEMTATDWAETFVATMEAK